MAETSRPPGDDDDAPDEAPRPHAFEHLGWVPSWHDRVRSAARGAAPGRLAAGAAAATAAAVLALGVLRGPAPPPPELTMPMAGGAGDPAASTTSTTARPAVAAPHVHAAGAVVQPGLYRLAPGARVADLLDAAGGPRADADLDRVNLAALLQDGERVFVPVAGQEVPPVAGGQPAGLSDGAAGTPDVPLDLNSATLDQLDTLPGVGPATGQAILDERERRGGFRSVEDLLEVRGIGEAKLAGLRDLVRV